MIISPTRELAIQISQVIDEFLKELNQFTKALFIGGNKLIQDTGILRNKG